jgi:hypothetical protein
MVPLPLMACVGPPAWVKAKSSEAVPSAYVPLVSWKVPTARMSRASAPVLDVTAGPMGVKLYRGAPKKRGPHSMKFMYVALGCKFVVKVVGDVTVALPFNESTVKGVPVCPVTKPADEARVILVATDRLNPAYDTTESAKATLPAAIKAAEAVLDSTNPNAAATNTLCIAFIVRVSSTLEPIHPSIVR